jgi:hypothetical protein
VLESEIVRAARAAIAAHGTEALTVVKRSAANVQQLGMPERVKWWERVAATIKEIEVGMSVTTDSAAIREPFQPRERAFLGAGTD